jgi:hypothetical protein
MFQLYSLYDHPLIEMPDGGIYALDAQFLRARVTEGAYWALFHALRQDNREGLLRDSCGHATEWYAAELLRSCCNKEGTKNLWLDWDGEINGKAGKPDAIYREGDTLYFVEVTTSAVTAKDASSGNPVVLGAALRRLWFGEGKGSSGKLTQLARAVRNFREGKLSIGGVSPKDITTIRPMLVTLRDFPQWPRLMDWYRELMTDAGMTEAFVNDVLLIDIEELEELAARLIAGEAWGSIFAQKRLANHPDMSVHNFLWATDRLVERPPFVTKNIEDAVTAFGKSLRED